MLQAPEGLLSCKVLPNLWRFKQSNDDKEKLIRFLFNRNTVAEKASVSNIDSFG